MPRTPSQKSIDVCRSAPTIVMWWTPWLWSFRIGYRLDLVLLDEFRLVLTALQAAPRHEVDAGLDHQRVAQSLADRLGERRIGRRPLGELDADRQRRVLLDARCARADEDVPADVGREGADDLAHGGREDVDPADDQHVVGAADAPHARPGAPARAGGRADDDVVAGAEAQERRGAVAQVGEDELAGRAVVHRQRGA